MFEEQTHHTNGGFQCRPFEIHHRHEYCPVSGSDVFINIFSTDSPEEPISGNIITSISDHLAQFLLFPIEKTKGSKKNEICKRNFKSLTGNELIEDLKSIDWNKALRLNQNQTNKSFKLFFHIFETLLDTYAPLKKLSNSELKLHSKPWITHGIMTSIKIKDKIYKKLLKSKNSTKRKAIQRIQKI